MAIMSNGRNRASLLFCQKLYAQDVIIREILIFVKMNIIRSKITGTLDLQFLCNYKMKMIFFVIIADICGNVLYVMLFTTIQR